MSTILMSQQEYDDLLSAREQRDILWDERKRLFDLLTWKQLLEFYEEE